MAMPNIGNAVLQHGDWKREKLLGSGAFGTVIMWKNVQTNQEIAIKRLSMQGHEQTMSRWRNEMRLIEQMDHPNIVSFIAIPRELSREYPPQYSLGMEYCSLGDLRRLMVRAEFCCGLPEVHLRDMLSDIGSAIHYIHEKNNLHRDLKPENIVLKPRPGENGRFQFKITDLGYAKDLDLGVSCGVSFVGTWHYLAPEFIQYQENLRYYKQVDFWSFGVLTFECITGYRPFFHNVDPVRVLTMVKEKKDEDICGWIVDKRTRFCQNIPKPHSLNPHFAQDLVPWFQNMLRVDSQRRGGQGEHWYNMLQHILQRKYVKVFNVANMEVLTFPVDEQTFLRTLMLEIQKKANIPESGQLLLLENGETPKVTGKMLDLTKNGLNLTLENVSLYLFAFSENRPITFKNELPTEILARLENNVELTDKDEKRLLQVSLNCTMKKVALGLLFVNALHSLNESVSRYAGNLTKKLKEFTKDFYEMQGRLNFFEESLDKDVCEFKAQDNSSGICVNKTFMDQCDGMSQDVEEWKKTLNDCPKIIKDAEEALNLFGKYAFLPNEIRKLVAGLHTLKSQSLDKYDDIRREKRKMEKKVSEMVAMKREKEELERQLKEYRRNSLDGFMRDCVKLAAHHLEMIWKPTAKYYQAIRILTDHREKMSKMLFDITGKMDILNCIKQTLKNHQNDRQHAVWHMLQYMKDIYSTADQYDRDREAGQELDNEMNGMLDVVDAVISDPDLGHIMNFDPGMFSGPAQASAAVPHQVKELSSVGRVSRTDSGTESCFRPDVSSEVPGPHMAQKSNASALRENNFGNHGYPEPMVPRSPQSNLLNSAPPTPTTPLLNSNNNNSSSLSDLEISGTSGQESEGKPPQS